MPDVLSNLLPVFGVAILFVIIAAVIKALMARQGAVSFPYAKQPTLFTPAERSFLGVLEQAVGNQHRVFGKVRLADVIRVQGIAGKKRQSAFNRIQSKHLDFVVCAANDLSIQCAVELDDRSHAKRKARDQFVDNAMWAAGVPLHRVPAKGAYSVQEVRDMLNPKKPLG